MNGPDMLGGLAGLLHPAPPAGGDVPTEPPAPPPHWGTPDGPPQDGPPPEKAGETAGAPDGGLRAALEFVVAVGKAHAKASSDTHGGLVNWLIHSKQPSIAEQMEYRRLKPWVKPGHEGGLLDRAGDRYQRRYGIYIVAVGNLVSGAGKRGLRAGICALIATLLTVTFLVAAFPAAWFPIVVAALILWAAVLFSLFV